MCLKMASKLVVIVFFFVLFCNVLANDLEEGSSCVLKDGTVGVCLKLSDCQRANENLKNVDMTKICSHNLGDPIVCCLDCNFIEDRFFDVNVLFDLKFQIDVNFANSEEIRHGIAEYKRKNLKCLEAAHIIQHFPCNKYEGFQDLHDSVRCYDNPYDTESLEATHANNSNKQPHLALIGYGDTPDYAGWPCSGSIISDQYILTAAHCTSSPALGKVKFAAMGIVQRSNHRRDWQIYDVVEIIVHPNYEAPSKYHDIALLKTGDKIRYNLEVIPACLQRDEYMAEVATAIGWGAKNHQQHPEDILNGVDVIKFSDKECLEAYPKYRHLINGYISTIQACYGDAEHTSENCEGDSGGVLQMRTMKKSAKCLHTIVGITAFGRACGVFGTAGLFTRLAPYVPWIEMITGPLS